MGRAAPIEESRTEGRDDADIGLPIAASVMGIGTVR